MPKFILSRPLERANLDEMKVHRHLRGLPDDWLIVWGYHYVNADGETCEGDFLVLGPAGGLMVIEAKGWKSLRVNADGSWGGDHGDNPFHQLNGQWDALRRALHPPGTDGPTLAVGRALALPNIRRSDLRELPHLYQTGALILTQEDLQDFSAAWDRCFAHLSHSLHPGAEGRQRFFDSVWGQPFTVGAAAVASDALDWEIHRLTRAQFPVLDHLPHYHRFEITGAAGSGKTWLALELALRWAGRDGAEPRGVLLLCYNLPLAHYLAAVCRRLAGKSAAAKRACERIEVRSWEDLVAYEFQTAGLGHAPPAEKAARQKYFTQDVPAGLELLLAEGRIRPRYDALVVDEAQDHDTTSGKLSSGWWALYRALLREPDTCPVAVAYDPGQRPNYWDQQTRRFDPTVLRAWLGPAVRLHCPTPLRYTRQIADYLAQITGDGVIDFAITVDGRARLPEGLPVEEVAVPDGRQATEVQRIAARWNAEGYATVEEIIVIGVGPYSGQPVRLCGPSDPVPLLALEERKKGQLGYVSAGRCKGLDARAVIVACLEPSSTMDRGHRQAFSLAASRARQLLAVITVLDEPRGAPSPIVPAP